MALHMMPRTTNLLTANQSSVETDLTGLSRWPVGDTEFIRDTSIAWQGGASARLTRINVAGIMVISSAGFNVPVTPVVVYTSSVCARAEVAAGRRWQLELRWLRADSSTTGAVFTPLTAHTPGAWVRLAVTGTSPADAAFAIMLVWLESAAVGERLWWDGALLEPKSYPTSWHLGGATRAPESLTLPTAGVLNPQEGTVEVAFIRTGTPSTWAGLFECGVWSSPVTRDWLSIQHDAGAGLDTVRGFIANGVTGAFALVTVTLPTETIIGRPYGVAFRWILPGPFRLTVYDYVTGLAYTATTSTTMSAPTFAEFPTASVGSRGTLGHFNGLIDDLRISNRARTDAEILAGFNSNAPLPPDADTTYLLRFDGHLPTRLYRPAGQRVSPVYNISSPARPLSILANWQESIPAGTTFTLDANISTDGGTTWRGWQSILNGGALLVSDLTNARLQLRQTFATNTDMTDTAGIEDIAVTVTLDQAGEMVPLGVYWTGDWHTNEREGYVKTTARDRMELLRTSTYSASQVAVNTTLHSIAVAILQDAGLTAAEYRVDTELQGYSIPYAWFDPQSHREALRKIAEACPGQVYCDRDGRVVVEGPSALARQGAFIMPSFPALVASENITADRYFTVNRPLRWGEVANYIEVDTQPLHLDVVTEVHRSNEPVPIAAGQTLTLTVYYNHVPSIEAVASLVDAPVGAAITAATYYAWGADVTITSPAAGTFVLVINAKPMKVLNKERAIAQDNASIREHGTLSYTFPGNPLVQTFTMAQRIADTLLRFYRDPRRDVEVDWRGNPALTLGDVVVVPDFDARHHYYVVRQTMDYMGALRGNLSGRKV